MIYGDAMDVMRIMPDQSVDLIVTDPPYPVISGGNGAVGRPVGMLSANDGKIFKHNDIHVSRWAPELYRVLVDPGHCYVMTNLLNLWDFHTVLTGVGFKVHNLLIWHKNTVTPNRWFMKDAEYILFLRKGKARSIYTLGAHTVIECNNVRGKRHPTEKPEPLLRQLIEASSLPGQVVFDPFAGSGSTIRAAESLGRVGIGVEIDTDY